MNSSRLKLLQAAFCLIIILSLTALTSGQTDSCSFRNGGSTQAGLGCCGNVINAWCTTTPTDLVFFITGPIQVTCRGCFPGNSNYPAAQASKGGTSNCTSYSKQMTLDFSQPVAELQWGISGARTVTDNRGYTVRLGQGGGVARFPGGGITSITISDPEVSNYDGSPEGQGFWEMDAGNVTWTDDATYNQCNCNRSTFARPDPQSPFSPDWNGNGIPDWRMDMEVSDDDGLVLKNIRLENRYMAEQISVPYYMLETNSITPAQRGELKPNSGDPTMASRLVNFNSWSDDEKLVVEATYVVGKIPEGSTNCLEIIQRYEFHKSIPGDKCEPSGTLPCARWKPIVSYKFTGPAQEFHNINIPQRHHFRDNGFAGNSVGLFRDCDYRPFSLLCIPLGGLIFTDKINPLTYEYGSDVIRGGQDTGKWDNFHQTFFGSIDEPFINPGCPECIHMHWRWGRHLGEAFGRGKPLIAEGSNQDVDIGVVTFRAPVQPNPEDDPNDYRDLFQEPESTQTFAYTPNGSNYRTNARDLVFWYASTGHLPQDTFSPTKGAFFNPSYQGMTATITEGPPPGNTPASSGSLKSPNVSASLSSQDHPDSIAFADLYEDGATTFSAVDPITLGTLPNGYAVYNSDVYDVVTAATVSGPHAVTFAVPSVTDQAAFNSLRILHVEPDSFDPEKPRFIDRTVLSPELPAPDFVNRKISAKVDGLGTFLLATYTAQPPNTNLADLTVSISDTPDAVVASSNLTYTVNITNNGPQTANEVMLKDSLAPEANFVSVTGSQGTCRELDGSVLCSLDSLAANANATVTIVVTPSDGGTPFPPAGKVIRNVALIKANEGDANLANNSFIESTTVMPDPNTAPTINITSPATGTFLVGPTNITVTALATDADGSVNLVKFYENGNLLGSGTLIGANQYAFSWNNVPFGSHILSAVATDNLGKQRASDPVTIIVNGSAAVSVASPGNWAAFNRPANITITANASISGGTISKVDFYEDGILLGTGTPTGGNQSSFTRNSASVGRHLLTAVATDGNGITTTSTPVNVIVNDPPFISLIGPASGTVFSSAPINITANASDWEGSIRKVDFFANGSLIGTSAATGVNQFTLAWNSAPAGTHLLTAIATDNFGATSSSAPISIRVNSAPTLTITGPTNGAQFTAPAAITLTANAADTDGTISKLEFFANGAFIGTATPIGGSQFSFTWSNVGIGGYGFTAFVTDNDGAVTSAGGPFVTVKSPVLFVTASTTLNGTETSVKARLEALNHTVIVKAAASAVTADATGKALVVISSTVTPTSVGTKFRTVTVPVLTWESGIYNNMGMTGSTNKDFGTKTSSTQVSITNPTHPLAAGFSGNTTVASSGTFNWGKPNANAVSVGIVVGDTTKTLVFGYEIGAVMPGLTAPARRVGFFMHDTTVLNSSGTALLDAAIKWARGGGSLSRTVSVPLPASVDLTAEGTVDWAHWGLNGPANFDHKSNVAQQISNFIKIGTPSPGFFIGSPTTFNWTNGTPTMSSSTQGGLVTGSTGNGYEITVPADGNLKILKLYVGAWYGQGRLEATLSDGSAAAFVDTTINSCGGGAAYGVYTISFKAGSGGQTLKLRYTLLSDCFAPNGKVALQSATLQ